MPSNLTTAVTLVCYFLLFKARSEAQTAGNGLFNSEQVLHLKLAGNTRALFNDRGDDAQYHTLVLSYKEDDSQETTFRLKAMTRGHFRRNKSNCSYPPILLNFQKKECANTLFAEQDKVKLVMPCRDDQFVIREYLVYKLYNLLTPKSFNARLALTTFYDTIRKKEASFYTMLLEEDEQMAARNRLKVMQKKKVSGESTEMETFLKMALFQYMIGNTDWSVPYQHNTRVIAFDSLSIPSVVPYDFDHAGIVNAPYALPPEELNLRSTQERRYRGYCLTDLKKYEKVIATFNRLKQDFYKVYTNCTLLDKKYISATIKFLDQFYATINNEKKLKEALTYPCNSTAPNVIIKGLKNSE